MKHLSRACVVGLLLPVWASAEITVLREYLMGDADPAMVVDTVVVTSQDSAGGADLVAAGAPLYYRSIERPRFGQHGQPQVGVGVEFDAEGSFTVAGLPGLVDNFGVEAWVFLKGGRLTVANGTFVEIKTNTSDDGPEDGWRIESFYINSGRSSATYPLAQIDGFSSDLGTATTASEQWHHIALVREQGRSHFYVNGVSASPVPSSLSPLAPIGPLFIGGNQGLIDEVRIFSFLPGQFRPKDLSYPMAPASPLEIATTEAGNLSLRWPGTKFKRVLETTTDLQSGVWTILADETTPLMNAFLGVSVPISGQQRFFRLNRVPASEWKGRLGTHLNNLTYWDLFAEVDASSISGRSARVGNGYRAATECGFDASLSIDPATGDSSAIGYNWEIFAPAAYAAQLGTQSLGRLSGISGLQTATLRLQPNSLPQLATIAGDSEATWWKVKLTLRHEPFDPTSLFPQEKTYWFRIRYTGTTLTVEQANAQLYPAEGL